MSGMGMTGQHTNDEKTIALICLSHLSHRADSIERCEVGLDNYVYIVTVQGSRYVIRLNKEIGAYNDTVYWLHRLREADIPVPDVIASGTLDGCAYIILSYIDGKDMGLVYHTLSDEEKRSIARDVVLIQNKAGMLECDTDDGWSWYDFLYEMLDCAEARIALNGIFDTGKVVRLRDEISVLSGYFDSVKPYCYLDDISTKNLLIHNGHLSGIIDVDSIGRGDILTFAAMTNTALMLMGYDTDYVSYILNELHADSTRRMAFLYYTLLFCVDFMGERGMTFNGRRVDAGREVIDRLNGMYDMLWDEWSKNKTGL